MTSTHVIRDRIDPEVRAGLDRLLSVVGPHGLSGISDISQRRAKQAELKALSATRATRPLPEQIQIRDHVVPGATEEQPAIRLRSYVPTAAPGPTACILYVHGGGLVQLATASRTPPCRTQLIECDLSELGERVAVSLR